MLQVLERAKWMRLCAYAHVLKIVIKPSKDDYTSNRMKNLAACVLGFVNGGEQGFGTGNERKDSACEELREERLLVPSFEVLDEGMSVGKRYPRHLLFSHVPGHVRFGAACAHPGDGRGDDTWSVKHD